jgi:hypothetical protein
VAIIAVHAHARTTLAYTIQMKDWPLDRKRLLGLSGSSSCYYFESGLSITLSVWHAMTLFRRYNYFLIATLTYLCWAGWTGSSPAHDDINWSRA